jgi:hypothetical protein
VGYVDCQSAITKEQAAVFRAILRQELEAAGVSATIRDFWFDERGKPLIGK